MTNSWWTKRQLLLACVAVVGLTVLSGCADGDDEGSVSDSGGSSAQARDLNEAGGDGATSTSAETVEAADLTDRELIKTATIGLESADIDQLLVELDGVVTTHQGLVDSEDIRTDDDGDAESATVVIRIPVDRFETAVDGIADLGVLVREQTSAEDVTTQVADVSARVASAERSIAQLQQLFSRAERLGDVIALESELSSRQAELESLQARQRALARQTALSTIHVSITLPDDPPAADDDDRAGFVDGIKSGWSGLVAFVQGVALLVGLVLPLGTLALVVGGFAWLVARRLHLLSRG